MTISKTLNGVYVVNENYKPTSPEDKGAYTLKSSYDTFKEASKELERLRANNPEKRFVIMDYQVTSGI